MLEVNRREIKYAITISQATLLQNKLTYVLHEDPHNGIDGYSVKSLYFDTLYDRDLNDKLNGCLNRQKIRLRVYGNSNIIKLELKEKSGEFQRKRSIILSQGEALQIINGNLECLLHKQNAFSLYLYSKMKQDIYRPKCVIEYKRKAFFLETNNTRVTFDSEMSSDVIDFNIFNNNCLTPSHNSSWLTLEIKYSEFLLSSIKQMLCSDLGLSTSIGKYAMCREFWNL